jgi:hypothetical protein
MDGSQPFCAKPPHKRERGLENMTLGGLRNCARKRLHRKTRYSCNLGPACLESADPSALSGHRGQMVVLKELSLIAKC